MRELLILSFLLISFHGSVASSALLSYEQWKSQRVSQAKIKYDRVLLERKRDGGINSEIHSRLRKARTNLVVAEELTANDYFQHYLSPSYGNQIKALRYASQKMKPSDLAEILMAYSAQLKELQQAPAAPPSSWLTELETPDKNAPNPGWRR
ncbi:MAG: hypothetical protein AB7F59_13900 [Bdellovibrionales bacterium]